MNSTHSSITIRSLCVTMLVAVPALAQNLTQFTNGQVADATAVNGNFTALKTATAAAQAKADAAQATADAAATTANNAGSAVTGLTNAITVNNGDVGIGANPPTAKLDVAGNLRLGGGTLTTEGNRLLFGSDSQNSDPIFFHRGDSAADVSNLFLVLGDNPGAGSNDKFIIRAPVGTTPNDKFAFTSQGRFGIGTVNPTSDFFVNLSEATQTPVTGGINLRNSFQRHWRIHMTSDFLRFSYTNSDTAAFTNLAYVDSTTGAWTTVSDRRLKADIQPVGPVLDRIAKVNIVQYRLKSDPNASRVVGVIAQEIQPLFPDVVTRDPGSEYFGVNYSGLGALAVKAVQEQQVVIEGLQARLTEVTQQNTALQARLEALEALHAEVASLKASLAVK